MSFINHEEFKSHEIKIEGNILEWQSYGYAISNIEISQGIWELFV
jgi:hypothetical protein